MQIIHIPAFNDNYIWLIKTQHARTFVVDPGDATPVLQRLSDLNWHLDGILITHHHHDHVGGVSKLLEAFPLAQVYAPEHASFDFAYLRVEHGQTITLDEATALKVIGLSGHTLSHVGYYCAPHAFVGDTLFSGGCGRLFEGSGEQMLASLKRLSTLPEATLIYSAHEYTQKNLQFALNIEPNNADLHAYLSEVSKSRQQGLPTLPCVLAHEKAINPFLRCHLSAVQQSISAKVHLELDELQAFVQLRHLKDKF